MGGTKRHKAVTNSIGNASFATQDFVKNHEASLEYFCQFGTPIEKIKAELLLKIAEGVSL